MYAESAHYKNRLTRRKRAFLPRKISSESGIYSLVAVLWNRKLQGRLTSVAPVPIIAGLEPVSRLARASEFIKEKENRYLHGVSGVNCSVYRIPKDSFFPLRRTITIFAPFDQKRSREGRTYRRLREIFLINLKVSGRHRVRQLLVRGAVNFPKENRTKFLERLISYGWEGSVVHLAETGFRYSLHGQRRHRFSWTVTECIRLDAFLELAICHTPRIFCFSLFQHAEGHVRLWC